VAQPQGHDACNQQENAEAEGTVDQLAIAQLPASVRACPKVE
jgi:hypothetical protein